MEIAKQFGIPDAPPPSTSSRFRCAACDGWGLWMDHNHETAPCIFCGGIGVTKKKAIS